MAPAFVSEWPQRLRGGHDSLLLRANLTCRMPGACAQPLQMEWRFRIETGMNVWRHALDPPFTRADRHVMRTGLGLFH